MVGAEVRPVLSRGAREVESSPREGFFLEDVQLIRSGKRVLDIPRLAFRFGEIVGVAGANGAGKTSLLGLLDLAYPPDAGRMFFQGRPAWPLRQGASLGWSAARHRLAARRQMTWVMENPYLFSGTVLRNATYGLRVRRVRPSDAEARALAALEAMGLGEYADRQVQTLSAGEQKRVALARSLCLEVPVLLLDEPTAHLDGDSGTLLKEAITRYRRPERLIVITTQHRQIAERLGAKIVMLQEGRVFDV